MTISKLLAKRFTEVMLDGKWIAHTNFREQIEDLNLEQATFKVASLNTIAALTFHVNYYIAGVLSVLKGGPLEIRDKYSFDLPALDSQSDWENLCKELCRNSALFGEYVEKLSDEKLSKHFVKEEYGTYQRNIDGMIEHCYYHLGQIVLIKKIIFDKDSIL